MPGNFQGKLNTECNWCSETGYREIYNYDFSYLGRFLSMGLHGVTYFCDCSVGKDLAFNYRKEVCQDCSLGIIETEKMQEGPYPFPYKVTSFCNKCEAGQKTNALVDAFKSTQREVILADWRSKSGMAPLQLKQTFDNYICKQDGPGEKAIVLLKTAAKEKKSLLLIGNTGVGKSHLAAAFLNFSISLGNFGLFISLTELMAALRKTITSKEDSLSWDTLLDKYITTPLLVLDDIGQEKPSEKVNEVLFTLLNSRINWERPTIVTTNFGKDMLIEFGYSPAIVSRLGSFEIVRLSGEDYRVKNRGNLKIVDPWA